MIECKKLNATTARTTITQCNRFSELVANKCPSKQAIMFALKRHCRYDSTKQTDGPVGFKTLRVHKNIKQHYNQNGWLLKEPSIGCESKNLKKPNMNTAWMQKYIKGQTSDINRRTNELETRINATSDFYKDLNRKYSFSRMKRPQLLESLKRLNDNNNCAEDLNYDKKVHKKVDELYNNLGKTRRKFKLIENYQTSIKALAKNSHEINFMNYHDKFMLEVLNKDRNLIEQFNNSNYKFPIYNTAITNRMAKKQCNKFEDSAKKRYSFRSLSFRLN